jgi:hypothetical protein
MHRSIVIAVGLALLLGGALGFVAGAEKSGVYAKDRPKLGSHHHSTECTAASLSGRYGMLGSGFFVRPDGSPVHAANLLLVDADGKGNASVADTVMPNGGPPVHRKFTSTYNVFPDCTGDITAPSLNVHIKIALIDGGRGLSFIQTDPGAVFSGRGAQTPEECDNSIAEGGYAGTFTGVVGRPADAKLGAAAWARISLDGEGNFRGVQITSVNGQIINEEVTGGLYAIDSNCHGSSSSSNAHSEFIVIDEGQQVLFLITDPGTVLTGTISKQ